MRGCVKSAGGRHICLQALCGKRIVRLMKKQNFWEVDLIALFKYWLSDILAFLMTALMFVGLSLPVVIPGLIMWYLWSINWHP